MSTQLVTASEKIASNLLAKDNPDVVKHFEESFVKNFAYKYLAQNVPASDIVLFFHKAQLTGAEPIRDEIYLIPRNTYVNGQTKTVGTIVFSYHFVEQKAQESGEYQGYEIKTGVEERFNVITSQVESALMSECTVKRNGHTYVYKAWFDEYAQRKKNGDLIGQWAQKPYLMLEKCAKAGALRSAFPEWLTGVYSREEMSQVESDQDEWIEKNTIEAKKVEQKAKMIEKIESMDEVDALVAEVSELFENKVSGKTPQQKLSEMKSLFGITKLSDLKNKSLDDLKFIKKKLLE